MRWLAHISFALLLAASAGYAVPNAPSAPGGASFTLRWSPESVQTQHQVEPSESTQPQPSVEAQRIANRPDPTPSTPATHPLFQRPPPASPFSL